jgi:hypothetical protein
MKFKFTCGLCQKEVKRGDKFQVDLDQYDSDCTLSGVAGEDDICLTCSSKIENKINSLRKSVAKQK